MIKARIFLSLQGIDRLLTWAWKDIELAIQPFIEDVIELPFPSEFRTNYSGAKSPLPFSPHHLLDGDLSHAVHVEVRGCVFQTDGTLAVWVGPDFQVNYQLDEIQGYFQAAGWRVSNSMEFR